jgi:hypothetical protein
MVQDLTYAHFSACLAGDVDVGRSGQAGSRQAGNSTSAKKKKKKQRPPRKTMKNLEQSKVHA